MYLHLEVASGVYFRMQEVHVRGNFVRSKKDLTVTC